MWRGGGVKHGIDSEFKPEFDGRLKWQTVAFDTTGELNRCRPLWLKYVPSLMITGSSVLSGAVSPSELQSGLTSNSEEKMFFKALEVSSLPTSKCVLLVHSIVPELPALYDCSRLSSSEKVPRQATY